LVRLVDDLMYVSRITRNKIELRKERVELASIIRQSVEACRPLAESAQHQVNVALPPHWTRPSPAFVGPSSSTQRTPGLTAAWALRRGVVVVGLLQQGSHCRPNLRPGQMAQMAPPR